MKLPDPDNWIKYNYMVIAGFLIFVILMLGLSECERTKRFNICMKESKDVDKCKEMK